MAALVAAAPGHLQSQLAAAEVYGRKGRRLLEAAAVRRAVDLAGCENPDVHRAVVRLAQRGASLVHCCVCMWLMCAHDCVSDCSSTAAPPFKLTLPHVHTTHAPHLQLQRDHQHTLLLRSSLMSCCNGC